MLPENMPLVTVTESKTNIRFWYKGKLNEKLDKHILNVAKEKGFKWYASGYDYEANEREHCFDLV